MLTGHHLISPNKASPLSQVFCAGVSPANPFNHTSINASSYACSIPLSVTPKETSIWERNLLIPYKYSDTSTICTNLPVEFLSPMETFQCDSSGGIYHNSKQRITLRIPENAVPVNQTHDIEVGASLYGNFKFPTGMQPVSPIVWVGSDSIICFRKPVEIILPHFLNISSESKSSELQVSFAKASHVVNATAGTYQFKDVEDKQSFTLMKGRGILYTTHYCFLSVIANREITKEDTNSSNYSLTIAVPRSIPVVRSNSRMYCYITYDLPACHEVIEEQFPVGYGIFRQDVFRFSSETQDIKGISIHADSPPELAINPRMITPQQVDFWELHELGKLKWKIDRKQYPPHFTIDVGQVTLPSCILQFRGVLPEYNLDTKILFQVTPSGGIPGLVSPDIHEQQCLNTSDKPTIAQLTLLKKDSVQNVTIIDTLAAHSTWRKFGYLLDFDNSGDKMELIFKENEREGAIACCTAMFRCWLHGEGRHKIATWEKLFELLQDCGETNLAKDAANILNLPHVVNN